MPAEQLAIPAPDLSRTLILAPLRKDAEYLAELLARNALPAQVCRDSEELRAALRDPPGLLITTHEALGNGIVDVVADHLAEQPDWSELPIIVLLDKSAPTSKIHAALRTSWARSRLMLYRRPVATLELLSGIQSLLLARLRQREVREHLEREAELRRELNHRVKNILASVLSILQLTRRGAATVDQLAADFTGRLQALADVHSAVFRAGGETVDLFDVVELTLAPYRNGTGATRVHVDGPSLTVSREAGTTIALSLHELVTNALKYGALSVTEGSVTLRWRVDGSGADARFQMEWVEQGGPPVKVPERTGYGTRYLRAALTGLLGSEPEIEFDASGLRLTVSGALIRLCRER